MARKHSRLPASSAHRWINCTGSVALSAKVPPSPTSNYANEGTAAAFLAEMCLRTKMDARYHRNKYIIVGEKSCIFSEENINDDTCFKVNDEMIGAVQLYLDIVQDEKGTIFIEYRVSAPLISRETGGTLDAAIEDPFRKLTIVDFKYGQGVIVEAKENEQLLIYLSGMAGTRIVSEYEVVIVQPRAPHPEGPVRRWTVTRKRLKSFEKKAKIAAQEALESKGSLQDGDHCRWCPASGQCPEQLRTAQVMAKLDFEIISGDIQSPELLPITQLAVLYSYEKQMANWFISIGKILREQLNAGAEVPGWKLVAGVGNRQWVNVIDAENWLRKRGLKKINIFDHPKPQLKSPAQIEKLKGGRFNTKKGLKEFVNTLTERPEREPNLVPATDKRLEHRPAQADFDDLTGEKKCQQQRSTRDWLSLH